MPPKSIKKCGKSRSQSQKKLSDNISINSDANDKPKTVSGLSQEAEDKFELELCYCIQQLELSVTSGSLREKQALEMNKHLRTLKSNSASLIKKRQIMRNIFGDYRQLMSNDEKKAGKSVSQVKFKSPSLENKCLFVRKYSKKNQLESSDSECKNADVSDSQINKPFAFNFQIQD